MYIKIGSLASPKFKIQIYIGLWNELKSNDVNIGKLKPSSNWSLFKVFFSGQTLME